MANNLLELSQSYELSFYSGFSANMFSKSTLCVIVTGGELLETQNQCIYLLSQNFLHLAQRFL